MNPRSRSARVQSAQWSRPSVLTEGRVFAFAEQPGRQYAQFVATRPDPRHARLLGRFGERSSLSSQSPTFRRTQVQELAFFARIRRVNAEVTLTRACVLRNSTIRTCTSNTALVDVFSHRVFPYLGERPRPTTILNSGFQLDSCRLAPPPDTIGDGKTVIRGFGITWPVHRLSFRGLGHTTQPAGQKSVRSSGSGHHR